MKKCKRCGSPAYDKEVLCEDCKKEIRPAEEKPEYYEDDYYYLKNKDNYYE